MLQPVLFCCSCSVMVEAGQGASKQLHQQAWRAQVRLALACLIHMDALRILENLEERSNAAAD